VPRSVVVVVLMKRALAFILGVAAFAAAHLVEAARWHEWFAGAYEPWFLNSGRAILFTIGAVAAASALAAAALGAASTESGIAAGLGAFVAMTVVLALKPGGPGTIFPIVILAGGVFLLAGTLAGGWMGARAGRALRRRR
jgi:hypothetical protein